MDRTAHGDTRRHTTMILEMKADGHGEGRIDNSNEYVVKQLAKTVEVVLEDCGFGETELVDELENENGRGLTPDMSELVGGDDGAIQNGIVPFSLEEQLEKENTGDSEGSANVTAIHVLFENSIQDTIEHLEETDQLAAAVKLFDSIREPDIDPSARFLTAYTVFTYAKGWFAERIVTEHERFAKLWISNDQKGQDMRDLSDNNEKQLKSVTYYAGNSKSTIKSKNVEHYFYQWTDDGLILGDIENANEVNKRAAKRIGAPLTAYKKSYSGGPVADIEGRSARILW